MHLLDKVDPVDIIFFDFENSVDPANHLICCTKLSTVGIDTDTFYIQIGDAMHLFGEACNRVLQGSVVGSLLFLLYVKKLADLLANIVLMFADDVKLIYPPFHLFWIGLQLISYH